MTIGQAIAFADWLNDRFEKNGTFRLPLVEEWLWAAYGKDRQYPWGNTNLPLPYGETTPVRSHPELRTPDGLFGMWNNVSEIVHSHSDGYGGESARHIRRPMMTKWLGESFDSKTVRGRFVQARQDYWGYTHSTSTRGDHIGFRVAFIPDMKDQ